MTTQECKQGDTTILQAMGRLDSVSAPEMDRCLSALISGGARQVVLDLAGLEYVSSAGLRTFLSAAKRMKQAQGRLALACPAPQIRQILDMAGFSVVLPIFATLPEAVSSCAGAVPPPSAPLASASGLLSLAEEIYLLALDDRQGRIKHLPASALDYALSAALLMELALADRIDTDATTLRVTSATPTGDPLLDEPLRELQQKAAPQTTSFWLDRFADRTGRIEERVLARLIAKGILKQENRRILWVFDVRRYPLVDDREIKEVRTRLRELILGDAIPDPRDVVLIGLGNACRLTEDLFTAEEFDRVRDRIAALAKLDLIGQATVKAVREIERVMAVMSMSMMTPPALGNTTWN
jgi:anti-anti-sigma factor